MRIVRTFIFCVAVCGILRAGDLDQWPKWRGPADNGMARGGAPPRWSDTENVKWKAAIPGSGYFSPVLWGDRSFLTTAVPTNPARSPAPGRSTEQRLLWQRTAATAPPHEGYRHLYGRHVYAFFGFRGIYCYDLDGALVWKKDSGLMKMRLGGGEGVAPAPGGGVLVLGFDRETGPFIAALDKNTGKDLWRAVREETSNWATPLIADFKGTRQAVAGGTKLVLWGGGLGRNVIPALVRQDDVIFAMGRAADLTGSDSVLWTNARGNSCVPSPVVHDNKPYVLSDRYCEYQREPYQPAS
jgi:outer membrane protein assembly factor BamB